MNVPAAAVTAAAAGSSRRGMGSLTRRMTGVAALWIVLLLLLGGLALERVLTRSIVRNFDTLEYVLNAIRRVGIGLTGSPVQPPAVRPRFIETYSVVYFQSAAPAPTPSSLPVDRRLQVNGITTHRPHL